MKLLYIYVESFTSYKQEKFDFRNAPNLLAIVGENGSGKSTFFVDALTAALFNRARGTTTQGTGLENLISKGADSFTIEVCFEHNGQEIKVIRRRFAKGGQELELYIDGVDHTDKIKETQAKLLNIIKMDYDTFLDTVVIKQGKSGTFMEKPANERKEVFTQILGLDKYDVLQEYTKELRKETNNEIKIKSTKLEDLSKTIGLKDHYEKEVLQGEEEIKKLSEQISMKEVELETELAEKAKYEQTVQKRNEILRKQQNLKQKIDATKDSIEKGTALKEKCELIIQSKNEVLSSLDSLNNELEEINQKLSNLNSEKSTLEGTNNVLRKQAKDLKTKYDRMKEFNEAVCNFCGQEVSEEHKKKHIEDLYKEASGYIKQIKTNEANIQNLDTQINELNSKSLSIKSDIRDLQNKKSQIEQAEVKLSGIITRLEELKSELQTYELEYQQVLLEEVESVENRTFNDGILKMELNNLRQQLSSWNGKVAVAKNELKKISEDEDKVLEIEKEIKQLKERYALLDDLAKAWGKEGIQAIIIDNALPEIQQEINDILRLLTNDQVSIEFITQKEKGKGKNVSSIETLEIIVSDQDGSRPYETYSGGEKFRVDFACHVGLAKYLSKRAGAAIDFFIVDEGVGSQDEVAKENFISVMHKISTIFDKVMVITHIPDVIDAFHNKVEVYKDPIEGSKIRLIN